MGLALAGGNELSLLENDGRGLKMRVRTAYRRAA
jgi:hypothetical protein